MNPASLLNVPVHLMYRAAPEATSQPSGERSERVIALVVALAVLALWSGCPGDKAAALAPPPGS